MEIFAGYIENEEGIGGVLGDCSMLVGGKEDENGNEVKERNGDSELLNLRK